MIEVKNLVKDYGGNKAVDDLSFTIEKGKVYGLLGPNGAGKSTTMNIMTGYIAATEGTVTINGLDIFEDASEAKKLIGYLPEHPPVYMDMTVKEYLEFAADLKRVPKAEQKQHILEKMRAVDIEDKAERLIKNLSKGYRQRVGMAQALIGDPEVIILDEPTVGLDPKQIIEIRELIRSLGKKHTVILSSHILSEVSEVCDEILIISGGKLVAADTTENLMREFASGEGYVYTVKGSAEAVMGALSVECVRIKSEENGIVTFVVDTKADIREDIFLALAKAGLPILELAASQRTLEDIFIELTGEEEEEAEK